MSDSDPNWEYDSEFDSVDEETFLHDDSPVTRQKMEQPEDGELESEEVEQEELEQEDLEQEELEQEEPQVDAFCTKNMTAKYQGSALSKSHQNRMYDNPFIEGDASRAIISFRIKNGNEDVSTGYKILLIFDTIVPQDVYFEPFVRVKLSGIRRNAEKKETLIMFQSTANYEIIAEKESFPFTFSVRTLDGTTNIAEFLTENDYKIKLYWERQATQEEDVIVKRNSVKKKGGLQPTAFATFNLCIFGASKYNKTIVKDYIVKILTRYDIMTVQEIRESSGASFPKLVADMNSENDIYDFHVGARQGRSVSKEQYGFIWNRNMFKLIDAYDYEDAEEAFERPPTVIAVERVGENAKRYPTRRFIVISVHIKPEVGATDMVTEDEIEKLKIVYEEAKERFPDISNVIIAGDMNADAGYVKDPEALALYKDPLSKFLIDFDADTTSKPTDAAYDHIILYGDSIQMNYESAQVFDFQKEFDTDNIFYEEEPITYMISDHFPVEFLFK